MVKYLKYKTRSCNFWGIDLTNVNLKRICTKILSIVQEISPNLIIIVRSHNPEDTYYSTEPNFFEDVNMPRIVKSIHIHIWEEPNVMLDLEFRPNKAKLTVAGLNQKMVEMLYSAVKEEVESYRNSLHFISKVLFNYGSFWGFIITLTTTGIAAFFMDEISVDLQVRFLTAILQNQLVEFNFNLFLLTFFIRLFFTVVTPLSILFLLRNLLPVVRFSGEIKDQFENSRWILKGITLIIVIPLILELLIN